MMKKDQQIELDIESYAFEGRGVAKIHRQDVTTTDPEKKYVIFCDGSYPGDKVKATLTKVKGSYAHSRIDEIIEHSPERVKPECKYFGVCGGCKQQDLDYTAQTKYKQEQVYDIFTRLGQLSGFEMEPIIPSEKIFHYRNKMEFSFAGRRWLSPQEIEEADKIEDKHFALGLHIPRIFDKVLDIDECWLQSPESNDILNFTREFFKSRDVSIYSTKTHEGYLRHLVIKESHTTDEIMVNLVTLEENDEMMTEYTAALTEQVPKVSTVINNINLRKAQIAVGDYERIYHGSGFIYDSIGGYKFRISANAFFQTNTLQAENLYRTALNYAEFTGDETVYDLYSGAGTISIYVSEKVKQVYAFESVESAVLDAGNNAKQNNRDNIHFFLTDLNRSFMPVIEDNGIPKPDVVIADPPRSGMNPRTVNDILKLNPKKIVYVSCNPTTQVRDINGLIEGGYRLIKIRPVDMFPHTYHIENVALLVKD